MVENKKGVKSAQMQKTSEKPAVEILVYKQGSLDWVDVIRNGTKHGGHLKFIGLTRFVLHFLYIMLFLHVCIVSLRYFYLLSTLSVGIHRLLSLKNLPSC